MERSRGAAVRQSGRRAGKARIILGNIVNDCVSISSISSKWCTTFKQRCTTAAAEALGAVGGRASLPRRLPCRQSGPSESDDCRVGRAGSVDEDAVEPRLPGRCLSVAND